MFCILCPSPSGAAHALVQFLFFARCLGPWHLSLPNPPPVPFQGFPLSSHTFPSVSVLKRTCYVSQDRDDHVLFCDLLSGRLFSSPLTRSCLGASRSSVWALSFCSLQVAVSRYPPYPCSRIFCPNCLYCAARSTLAALPSYFLLSPSPVVRGADAGRISVGVSYRVCYPAPCQHCDRVPLLLCPAGAATPFLIRPMAR